jgi:hypothetical protein
MFDHVVLRRASDGRAISAGQIAEALLYYQKVHLVIDRGTLLELLKQLGIDALLSLLRRADTSAVYCEEILATKTDSVGPLQTHAFVAFMIASDASGVPLKTAEDRLLRDVQLAGIDKQGAKRFVKAFLTRVPTRKLSGTHFATEGITESAKRDVLNQGFVADAVREALRVMPGGYAAGPDLKFDVIDSELGLYVFTNIDLESVNRRRAALTPAEEPVTVAHLLNSVQEARADLTLASFYGGDFVTAAATSAIIQVRHAELLKRSTLNAEARDSFIEVVMPDSRSLAEVIDSGERTFGEFLLLLDRAARFKDWLKKANPDEGLIRSYVAQLSSESWIQRLPAKSLRYVLTLALDATNPVAGAVAGFADSFIVEKLLQGWRPNHFVASRLRPFIEGK